MMQHGMQVGLIGYGKMGKEIFKLVSGAGHPVTVFVRSEAKASQYKKRLDRSLERCLRKGIITEETFYAQKATLLFTSQLEDLASANIVIESIVENYQEKLTVFHQLESFLDPKAIFVTNTSSLSITGMAQELTYKERLCGLHFFYPIAFINLVEIITWAGSSPDCITVLLDFCKTLGKRAIVVQDAPGSAMNGILADYYMEALYILEQGLALPSKIDELGKQFFYIGPCESLDVIGIDFFIEALEHSGYKERKHGVQIPDLLYKMVSEKRRGKKDAQGIFLYQGEKARDDLPEFYRNPEQTHSRKETNGSESFLSRRLLYAVFHGAIYSVEQGFSSIAELDAGVQEILNMKEGPFTMMNAIGIKKLQEDFDLLVRQAGTRFKQAALEKLFK